MRDTGKIDKSEYLRSLLAAFKQKTLVSAREFSRAFARGSKTAGAGSVSALEKRFQRAVRWMEDHGAMFERKPGPGGGVRLISRNFELPPYKLSDNAMELARIGARFAGCIAPEPMRQDINSAIDELLGGNSPGLDERTSLDSLIIASELKVLIDKEVFRTVFDCWKARLAMSVTYKDGKTFNFDPHVLTYQNNIWYTVGEIPDSGARRTLALHRIKKASRRENKTFESDPIIIKEALADGAYKEETFKNIIVRCSPKIAERVREQSLARPQTHAENPDGSVTVKVSSLSKRNLLFWIFSDQGEAEVLGPPEAAALIHETAARLLKLHPGPKN